MIRIEADGCLVWIGTGLIGRLDELLPPGRRFLVTDENVLAAGWAECVAEEIGRFVVPAGESSKSFMHLQALVDAMLEAGIERSDSVVAIGGGVVGDLAGFAAATVKRGCGFVQVPTSLLAQADAAIGGKTAINTRQGKNLVGAFHIPSAVIVDVAALATLPEHELRSGYAEVVKYGLIGDPAFYAWCERHAADLLAGDEATRRHAVEACVRAKLAYVADDKRDTTSRRALLNFGHSFGHAIEAETGLPHGEAVALGMALAFRFSTARGLCPAQDATRAERHLSAAGLPTHIEGLDPDALARRMAQDKKRAGGRMRLVLTRGIGAAFVDNSVDPHELQAFLERDLAGLPVA